MNIYTDRFKVANSNTGEIKSLQFSPASTGNADVSGPELQTAKIEIKESAGKGRLEPGLESIACQALPVNSANWKARHLDLARKARNSTPSIVFYGDSIVSGMSAGNALKNAFLDQAENFGIAGDCTQNLLWRLQHGEAGFREAPEICVLLIGANNLKNQNEREIVWGILANLKEGIKLLPASKWLISGLLPQGIQPDDPRRKPILEINKMLKRAVSGVDNLAFFDAGPVMLETNGSMSERIWWGDGMHPRNYSHMFEALRLEFEKLKR